MSDFREGQQPRSEDGKFGPKQHLQGDADLGATDRTTFDEAAWNETFEDYLDRNPEIRQVAAAIEDAGTDSYIVGGLTRDLVLKSLGQYDGDPNDVDMTSSLTPDQFRAAVSRAGLRGTTFAIGEDHGTVGHTVERDNGTRIEIEHTTFRAETYETEDSRRPTVTFGGEGRDEITLEDDLSRRDFTINAMAVNASNGEIVDPFGGLADLETGVLRTPGDPVQTMKDDRLRGFRAVRFAATRNYSIEDETAAAIVGEAGKFHTLSAERRRDEIDKIVSAGSGPAGRALALTRSMSIDHRMFEGMGEYVDTDALSAAELNRTETYAVLVNTSDHWNDDDESALSKLKFTNEDRRNVGQVVQASLGPINDYQDTPMFRWHMRRNGAEVMRSAVRVDAASGNHTSGYDHERMQRTISDNAHIVNVKSPINGRDVTALGFKGKAVGRALDAVEWGICENAGLTREEALDLATNAATRYETDQGATAQIFDGHP